MMRAALEGLETVGFIKSEMKEAEDKKQKDIQDHQKQQYFGASPYHQAVVASASESTMTKDDQQNKAKKLEKYQNDQQADKEGRVDHRVESRSTRSVDDNNLMTSPFSGVSADSIFGSPSTFFAPESKDSNLYQTYLTHPEYINGNGILGTRYSDISASLGRSRSWLGKIGDWEMPSMTEAIRTRPEFNMMDTMIGVGKEAYNILANGVNLANDYLIRSNQLLPGMGQLEQALNSVAGINTTLPTYQLQGSELYGGALVEGVSLLAPVTGLAGRALRLSEFGGGFFGRTSNEVLDVASTNHINGLRLNRQLEIEQAKSLAFSKVFTNTGELTQESIANAEIILRGSKFQNPMKHRILIYNSGVTMKVKCIDLYNKYGKVNSSSSLTIGKEYVVLEMSIDLKGNILYRLISDNTKQPFLYDSSQFELVSGKISGIWVINQLKDGSLEFTPEAWQVPGFWENCFDGDEKALEIYRQEAKIIVEEEGFVVINK